MTQMINLLPQEERQRLRTIRRAHQLLLWTIGGFVSVAALVLVLLVWWLTTWEARLLAEHTAESLEANLAPFQAVQEQAIVIADRLESRRSLLAGRQNWASLFNGLAAATPPDVQILSFTPAAGQERTFKLEGEAGSRASALRFKQALAEQAGFAKLAIETSQLIDASLGDQVSFTLTGSITSPEVTTTGGS